MLEVCIDSLESARNAINAGAHEIEICSSLHSGGLTPSLGLVVEVLALVWSKYYFLNLIFYLKILKIIYKGLTQVDILITKSAFFSG